MTPRFGEQIQKAYEREKHPPCTRNPCVKNKIGVPVHLVASFYHTDFRPEPKDALCCELKGNLHAYTALGERGAAYAS